MSMLMQQLERIVGPHSLERYAPMFQVVHALMFVIGALFWIDSMSAAKAFTPETWGQFAYTFPAAMWAGIIMLASSACLIGLIEPIHRRMVIVGGAVNVANYIAISYSAFLTGGDPAVGLYASVFFLPLNILMVAGALTEWKP